MWIIEAVCFTATETSVYVGTETEMRAHLDALSGEGWQVVKAFPCDTP